MLNMKRITVACIALVCALGLTAGAADGKKKNATPEQQAVIKELLQKYDTNKDGKLDKQEKSAMTKADKQTWAKAHKHSGKDKENTK